MFFFKDVIECLMFIQQVEFHRNQKDTDTEEG